MKQHPPILEEHRIAPEWKKMNDDQRAEHWQRVWGYYRVFAEGIADRPDRAEVQSVLDLNTPPELAQKYRY